MENYWFRQVKRTKYYLKTARKTVLFTKGLLPARAHSNGLPAPDELLIKEGQHPFPDGPEWIVT